MKKPVFLVVQAARFGDLVQTRGLIQNLQKQGEAHLCLDHSLAELGSLLFPQVFIHPVNFHEPLDQGAAILDNRKIFYDLISIPFTKIYNCNFSRLSSALCRLFPQKSVVSYRASRQADGSIWRSEWMRLIFRLAQNRRINSINLVDIWRLLAQDPMPPAQINPPARKGGGGIGIVLSGRMTRRSLPVDVLAPIAIACAKQLKNPSLRLFGLPSDRAAARKFLRMLPPDIMLKSRDLTGATDWQSLAAELANLDLLLTPDTGTMHFAASLGIPVMAFFLSSAWCHETGPYGAGHLIWQACFSCSPCLESEPCPYNWKCLEPFGEQAFLRAIVQALDGKKVSCPPNMQLWGTAFDSLGQRLELLAGSDNGTDFRNAARAMIAGHLELEIIDFDVYSASVLNELVPVLFPESEWMLPPWRYC